MKIGDIRTKALILGFLGDCHAGLKEYEKAIDYYEQAIEADRHLGHKRNEGLHIANAGDTYVHLGDHPEAIEHYQHALRIAAAMEDDELKAITLTILGQLYSANGAYWVAIDKYKEALRTCAKGDGKKRSPEESRASPKLRRFRLKARLAHERFSELLEEAEESGLELEEVPEVNEALAEWTTKERVMLKESDALPTLEAESRC